MAVASVFFVDIRVLDNPAPFTAPIKLEIHYFVRETLQQYITWKVIYDQNDRREGVILGEVLDGPVFNGPRCCLLETNTLDSSRLHESSILGPQGILLMGTYAGQEFLRVAYHMDNEYVDENQRMQPPQGLLIERVQRSILSDKPIITMTPINFHPENAQGERGQAAPDPGKKRRLRSRL